MAYRNGPKIITDGLVLCLDAAGTKSYPGSGSTWYDVSGNGNNGTFPNGITFDSQNHGSFIFDGSDEYSVHTAISLYNISYSISAWIKRNSSKLQGIMSDHQYAFWGFYLNANNALVMRHYTNMTTYSTNLVQTSDNAVSTDWAHVVGVFDKTSGMSLFVDGSLSNSNSNTDVSILNSSGRGAQYIGLWRNVAPGITNAFDGKIANLQFYTRALFPEEILQNYNATKGRFGL